MSELAGDRHAVAERLGICVDLVDDLTARGQIPHVKLAARTTLYPWRAIDEWLEQRARLSLDHGGTAPDLGLVADNP